MAFTASWIADVVLELVELEELCDSPRSSLSDSVVELLSKRDRSELIELVLIPLLLLIPAAGLALACFAGSRLVILGGELRPRTCKTGPHYLPYRQIGKFLESDRESRG